MSNKNTDAKPLEGYTVENNLTPDEAADRFANKWPHVAMKCARESFLSGANWQKEQYTERVEGTSEVDPIYKDGRPNEVIPIGGYSSSSETPSTSTTIEALAEKYARKLMSEYDETDRKVYPIDDESYINGCIIGAKFAYNLRDKEQAEVIKRLEKENQELRSVAGVSHGILPDYK